MRIYVALRCLAGVAAVGMLLATGPMANAQQRSQRVVEIPRAESAVGHRMLFVKNDDAKDGEEHNVGGELVLIQKPSEGTQRIVFNLDQRSEEQEATEQYWIGVMCSDSVEESLRAHLELPEGRGLQVLNVVKDSPAAQAGLKKFDILTHVGDQELNDVAQLVVAVRDAGDSELSVQYLRAGKSHVLKLRPAIRPRTGDARAPRDEDVTVTLDGTWVPGVVRDLDLKLDRPGAVITRFLGPGVVFHPSPDFPEDLEVMVRKKGKSPTRIVVKRGEDRWEVAGESIEDLPEDIRAHVAGLLGRSPMQGHVRFHPKVMREEIDVEIARPENIIIDYSKPVDKDGESAPGKRITSRFIPANPEPAGGDRVERRFRQIDERLERLQGLLERLYDRLGEDEEELEIEVEDE